MSTSGSILTSTLGRGGPGGPFETQSKNSSTILSSMPPSLADAIRASPGDDTVLHHLKLSRGGVGDVEDATFVQGFDGDPVVDPKLYFAVVVQVANADARIERQIVVDRGELLAVERLARCRSSQDRAPLITTAAARQRPEVQAFRAWVVREAAHASCAAAAAGPRQA